jgi:hypothetical protein
VWPLNPRFRRGLFIFGSFRAICHNPWCAKYCMKTQNDTARLWQMRWKNRGISQIRQGNVIEKYSPKKRNWHSFIRLLTIARNYYLQDDFRILCKCIFTSDEKFLNLICLSILILDVFHTKQEKAIRSHKRGLFFILPIITNITFA